MAINIDKLNKSAKNALDKRNAGSGRINRDKIKASADAALYTDKEDLLSILPAPRMTSVADRNRGLDAMYAEPYATARPFVEQRVKDTEKASEEITRLGELLTQKQNEGTLLPNEVASFNAKAKAFETQARETGKLVNEYDEAQSEHTSSYPLRVVELAEQKYDEAEREYLALSAAHNEKYPHTGRFSADEGKKYGESLYAIENARLKLEKAGNDLANAKALKLATDTERKYVSLYKTDYESGKQTDKENTTKKREAFQYLYDAASGYNGGIDRQLTDENGESVGIRYKEDGTVDTFATQNARMNTEKDENFTVFANYATDEQLDVFAYIYNKYGESKAKKYVKDILPLMSENAFRKSAEKYKNMSDVEKFFYGGATHIKGGLSDFAEGVKGAGKALTGNTEYTPMSVYQAVASGIRNEVKNPVAGAALDVTRSVSNMAPSMALGFVTGNPLAASISFGVSAGGGAYTDAINSGHSWGESLMYGAAVGAAEAYLQNVLGGISGFGKSGLSRIASTGAGKAIIGKADDFLSGIIKSPHIRKTMGVIGHYVGDGASEFVEEGLQEILDPVFRNGILGENNEIFTKEKMGEVFYAGLLGFFTAGVLNIPETVSNNAVLNRMLKRTSPVTGTDIRVIYEDASTRKIFEDITGIKLSSDKEVAFAQLAAFNRGMGSTANKKMQFSPELISEVNKLVDKGMSVSEAVEEVGESDIGDVEMENAEEAVVNDDTIQDDVEEKPEKLSKEQRLALSAVKGETSSSAINNIIKNPMARAYFEALTGIKLSHYREEARSQIAGYPDKIKNTQIKRFNEGLSAPGDTVVLIPENNVTSDIITMSFEEFEKTSQDKYDGYTAFNRSISRELGKLVDTSKFINETANASIFGGKVFDRDELALIGEKGEVYTLTAGELKQLSNNQATGTKSEYSVFDKSGRRMLGTISIERDTLLDRTKLILVGKKGDAHSVTIGELKTFSAQGKFAGYDVYNSDRTKKIGVVKDKSPKIKLSTNYNGAVDNVLSVSDKDAKALAEKRVAVQVLEHTPEVILNNVESAKNLRVIINYSKLYLAVRKDGVFKGHYHNLGANIAKKLPEILQSPDAIIQLSNGRLNILAYAKTEKGNNKIVSVELNSTKDIGGKNGDYNVVVTMFGSDDNYVKNLVSGDGVAVKYKKEDLSQVNPQLYKWLATINDKSSQNEDTVPFKTESITESSASFGDTVSSNNNIPQSKTDVKTQEMEKEEAKRQAPDVKETERTGRLYGASEAKVKSAVNLSNILGIKIVFYKTVSSENGYYSDGVIHVNVNSVRSTSWTVAHELTHYIEQAGIYEDIKNSVLEKIADLETKIADKQASYKRRGVVLSREGAERELVANYIAENLLTNEEEIKKMVRYHKGFGEKVLEFADRCLARITGKSAERSFFTSLRERYSKAFEEVGYAAEKAEKAEAAKQAINENEKLNELSERHRNGDITDEEYADEFAELTEDDEAFNELVRERMEKGVNGEQYSFEEEIKKADEFSETDFRNLLERVQYGELQDSTYIPMRATTPKFFIDVVREHSRGKINVMDVPLATRVEHLRQNMEEEDGLSYGKERPHNLSPDDIVMISKEMGHPAYIVLQKNGRYAMVVSFYNKAKKKVVVSIDFASDNKDNPQNYKYQQYMNGYSEGYYNIIVTQYEPDDFNDYLKDTKIVYDKKEMNGRYQVGSGRVVTFTHDIPFINDSISDNSGFVNRKFSYEDTVTDEKDRRIAELEAKVAAYEEKEQREKERAKEYRERKKTEHGEAKAEKTSRFEKNIEAVKDALAVRSELKGEALTTEQAAKVWSDYKKVATRITRLEYMHPLSAAEEYQVNSLLGGYITLDDIYKLDKDAYDVDNMLAIAAAKFEFESLASQLREFKARKKEALNKEADTLIEQIGKFKDKLSGLAYQRETAERIIRDVIRKSDGSEDSALADGFIKTFFRPVHQNEALRKKYKEKLRERVRAFNISKTIEKGNTVSEAYAVQFYGEVTSNIEYLEKSNGRIKDRDGKTLAEWYAVKESFLAANPKLDMKKVEKAVSEFRTIYDELFEEMNKVRIENGYEPVPYRYGYFPHFSDETGDGVLAKLAASLGIKSDVTVLPTSINGLTHTFKPGIRWMSQIQERTGYATAYDVLEGFEKYIEASTDVIYHTGDIQRLRALANRVRYNASDEALKKKAKEIERRVGLSEEEKQELLEALNREGRYTGSNFVVWLDDYTNKLANKQVLLDRITEQLAGRKLLNIGVWGQSRVAANMIVGNIGSYITNVIPIAQGWSLTSSKSLLRGMWHTLRAVKNGDDFIEANSVFIANRRGENPLSRTKMEAASDLLMTPMEMIDTFTTGALVRGRFYDNLKRGMSEELALEEADSFTANVMADRSKGSMPLMFEQKNPVSKLFSQFQLEVNNQLSFVFKDLPRETRERGVAALAFALLKFCIGAWLFDELFEYLFGRRPALDPINMLNDFVGDVSGKKLPNVIDEMFNSEPWSFDEVEKPGVVKGIKGLGKNVAENLPFVGGLLGGGRIPTSSAIPDVGKMIDSFGSESHPRKKLDTVRKELMKPVYYLAPPFAGGLMKKAIEGTEAVISGGSYTVNSKGEKELQYPVPNKTVGEVIGSLSKAVLLGKTSTKGGQKWIESNFDKLSAGYTAVYEAMTDTGAKQTEAFDFLTEMSKIKKDDVDSENKLKREFLSESGYPNEIKAIIYRGVLANEKEAAIIDKYRDKKEVGEIYNVLSGFKDESKDDGKRAILLGADLPENMKSSIYFDLIVGKGSQESEWDKVFALSDANIDFDGYLLCKNKYSEINGIEDEEYGASGKALDFALWVDTNFTASQSKVIKEEFKYYSMSPASTDGYEKLLSANVKPDSAYRIREAIGKLEPHEGKTQVSNNQKAQAILGLKLEKKETMDAISTVIGESAYLKVQYIEKTGLKIDYWFELEDIINEVNASGKYGSGGSGVDQGDVKEAVKRLSAKYRLNESDRAVLWQLRTGSKAPHKNPFNIVAGSQAFSWYKKNGGK